MKNFVKNTAFTLCFFISFLFSQSPLKLPEGGTFKILIETPSEQSPISEEELESVVKLRLRRNGISYNNTETDTEVGYFYITLQVLTVDYSKKLYVYAVTAAFARSGLYQVLYGFHAPDYPIESSLDFIGKGLGPFFGAKVWDRKYLGYTNVSPSKDIKETVEQVVDLFSSEFLDDNSP